MKTFIELKDEIYDIYGDEFDFQKIYNNLQHNIFKDLQTTLDYGETCHFGGADGYDFSYKEKEWMVLQIIESLIGYDEILLEIQDPDEHITFSDDKSFKFYLESYERNYERFLEGLHNLRNGFRGIKVLCPENYPDWIDQWELCLHVDIGVLNRVHLALNDKKVLCDVAKSLENISRVISCLVKRCDEFIERHRRYNRREN